MRELKFRAWNTVRNCWTSRVELDGGWGKPMFMHGEIEDDGGYQIDNTIIEQYTGLKDKNGREIYEGDIVQIDDHILGDFEVVWHNLGWKIKRSVGFEALSVHKSEDIVVIGNIHENGELLELKNEAN